MARDSRLALARAACDLTQEQLAVEAGVSRGTITGAENGRRPWYLHQLNIAAAITRRQAKRNGRKRVTKRMVEEVRREIWP